MKVYNTIIIGGGPSGLTAAIVLGRSEIDHLVFSGDESMLDTTTIVENYPGFPAGIAGYDLVEKFRQQALTYGSKIISKFIVRVDFSEIPFRVYDSDDIEYKASTIIIATGSKPNKLNLENEDQLWGNDISSCVVCHGSFFKDKKICIVGGAESALEEAIMATKYTNDVTLIRRTPKFKASVVMQKRVLNDPKIKIVDNCEIVKINTDGYNLTSVTCKNCVTCDEKIIPVDGMFYALGFSPNNDLFQNILELKDNYIVKKQCNRFQTMTSIKGVFTASEDFYRIVVGACFSGEASAIDCINYLHDMHIVKDFDC